MSSDGQPWYLYLLRNERSALYTGISTDPARRLAEHRGRSGKGARFTRGCKSLKQVFVCETGGRSLALKAERRVKGMNKADKERLVASRPERRQLLEMLDLNGAIVE